MNDSIATRIMPKGAVGVVALNNNHYNLYGNLGTIHGVYLMHNGTVVIDGKVAKPNDVLYGDSGGMVRWLDNALKQEAFLASEAYYGTLVDASKNINRKIASKPLERKFVEGEDLMAYFTREAEAMGEWRKARYPKANPHTSTDAHDTVDKICPDKHNQEAIKEWVIMHHLDKHSRFEVGGYIHVSDGDTVITPDLLDAVKKYDSMGGSIGRTFLELMS